MDNKELPENIKRVIDMVSAVIRRIQHKRLDNCGISCFCIAQAEGVTT